MQDRFRFRLYDKEKGLMLYEDSEILRTEKVYEYEELWWANVAFPIKAISRFFDYNSEERFVLQQCTGMKATKGQLLYEGDIVRFFSCSIIDAMSERHPMEERIGQIVWNEEEMKFDVMVGGKAIPSLCKKIDDNNFELIGNIYENPELLEEKK